MFGSQTLIANAYADLHKYFASASILQIMRGLSHKRHNVEFSGV